MTPEELVARGDAPVKPEFIRKVARIRVDAVSGSLGAAAPSTTADGNQGPAKKKSKNQLKRVSLGIMGIAMYGGHWQDL